MAPALETSVKGGFPNLLPSPVRAIVDAHQRRQEIRRGAAIPRLDIVTEEDEALDNFPNPGNEGPLKSTSRLATPVVQSVPVDLRPDYSTLWSGSMNFEAAPKAVLTAEVRRLRVELRKAEEVSKIERSINEAANAQLILRDLHLAGLMEQWRSVHE